jgi:hypothetical protein
MRVQTYACSEVAELSNPFPVDKPPAWGVLYAVEDFPVEPFVDRFRAAFPSAPLFGTTSFRGVFVGRQFFRGGALLLGDEEDGVSVATSLQSVTAEHGRAAATAAARELTKALGQTPDLVVLHATPGFEESLLLGIVEALGPNVEVYGGSAADDSIAGRWRVFSELGASGEGFVLAGFSPRAPKVGPRGGFLSGYLPTGKRGVVTRARKRVIEEIDGEAAALVYNRWTAGVIAQEIGIGGNVLLKTNLHPLARVVDGSAGVPQRLLSHPHEVHVDGGLGLFTDIAVGDEVELVIGTSDPLVTRAAKVVSRSLGRTSSPVAGGLLVYCGGCLAAVMARADEIASNFDAAIGGAPYVGVATFGEQGCFPVGRNKLNRHGNLMCSCVLVTRA